ncbi:MAG TPA: TonB-dependent receptor [Acidobacteriaceae bacterium]|nr:TonB-dependent receptor [Acidobacteriaceae bacterium]
MTILGGWGAAAAQTVSDQDLMSLKIEDLSHVQVYSASRHLEDIRKAPSSVSIITADEIRHYGWRTLGEALRTLRGFYISDNLQYTYLGVRGFMRPGDDNPRILLLVNGHRLNDRLYDTAAIGTEFPLDMDLIDHIEVVRGPGSSLFGTNAVFGVINVITRPVRGSSAVEIAADTGSYWSRTGRTMVEGRRGELSGLLSASGFRTAGEPKLFFPVFNSAQTNNGNADNADGAHLEQAFADLRMGNFRLQGMLADRVKQFPTGGAGSAFNDPANRDNDARGYLDLSFERHYSSDTQLQVRGYYDGYNYVGSGDYANPAFPSPVAAFTRGRATWTGAEATVTQQFGQQKLTVGGDYEYSLHIRQRAGMTGQADVFRSDESPWMASAYADAELSLGRGVLLHLGGRLDDFSTFGQTVSPRAALIWLPGDSTTVKYIVGQAFRTPNAYQEYYADGITVTAGPRPLVPERILSNELVVEQHLFPWLSVTVDGYYNQLKQLIDQVPAGNNLLTYFVNDDRIHAEGLEFELTAERKSGLGARASYSAANGKDDAAGVPLGDMPHGQARFNGTAPLGRWGFVGLESIYVSAMTDGQGTRVPAYLLPDITLSSRPLRGWKVASSCYDFSNQGWFSPAGPSDPESQIHMDGRTWRLSLSYRVAARGGGREP